MLAVRFTDLPVDVSASLDLGVFTLNKLTFDNRRPATVSAGNTGGARYRFAGAAPEVVLSGASAEKVGLITLASPSNELLVSGAGTGNMSFNSPIIEETAGQRLVIQRTQPRSDLGYFQLDGNNTFTGGVDLRSGTLLLSQAGSLGSGNLIVRGGQIGVGTVTIANNIQLYSDLVIVIAGSGTLSGVISSQVAGTGLEARGDNLTLTNATTYTGATTVDHSYTPGSWIDTTGPVLTLSGSGSLLNSSAYNVRTSSRLLIEAASTGPTNRLSDTAPIRLQGGGELRLHDGTATGVNKLETVGNVELAGQGIISFDYGSAELRLNIASLQRPERGTLLVRGVATVTGAFGLLFSTTAPAVVGGGAATGPTTSIVPYAIGDSSPSGAGFSFVTYRAATGFRVLSTFSDYAASITAGATQNVRLVGADVSSPTTVNSLWLSGGAVTKSGSGSLAITSGALASEANSNIAPDLLFGSAEAIITPLLATLTISGAISGSNGLTKAGAGTLSLQATNPFTGPLTISNGTISFSAGGQLGADTSAILIHGLSSGLSYRGTTPFALTRPLTLGSGMALVAATSAGDLTLTGGTSGPGGLQLLQSGSGRIVLTPAVQHADYTIFNGGRITFDNDSWLGAGGDLGTRGAAVTLELGGDWTSSRRFDISSPLTLQTNGHNVVWKGPLSGNATINKITAGDVRLTAPSIQPGTINFDRGTLAISGAGATRSATVNLTGGAVLTLENGTQPVSNRLIANNLLTITDGQFELQGNAGAPVVETLSTITRLYRDAAGSFGLTLTAPGSAGTFLNAGTIQTTRTSSLALLYPAFTPPMLLTGDKLGGGPGGGFSRIVLTSNPAAGFRGEFVGKSSGVASFLIYDTAVDAAGPIGFRPLTAGEYSSATLIQNPANGGATPTSAHLFLTGAGAAGGASNTAHTLTLDPGSVLSLSAGQALTLSLGGVVARAGAAPSRIEGGTLNLDAAPLGLYVDGELQVVSTVTTTAALVPKTGPGSLYLPNGAVVAKPLFIQAGTVNLSGTTALATVDTNVGPGGRLEGTGSTPQPVLVAGTLAPGDGVGLGTIDTGDLRMLTGAKLELKITGQSSYDQVRVHGTVELAVVQLSLDISGDFLPNTAWPVLLNDGGFRTNITPLSAFAIGSTVLTEGAAFEVNGYKGTITYKGGDGNDVYLMIPEPATAGLLAFGALGLCVRRRPSSRRP